MNDDMIKYLKDLSMTNYHPVTFSGNFPTVLNRWLVKCEYKIPDDPISPEPILSMESKIVGTDEINSLPKEESDVNWRYYISTNPDDFYSANYVEPVFSSRKDKTIYCLNSIYCEKDEYLLLHYNAMTPISIWIDGELASKSHALYHSHRNNLFTHLKRGIHFVLVERVALRKNSVMPQYNHFFYIAIKPLSFLQKGFEFVDKKELAHYQKNLMIIPERVINESSESVNVIVVPNQITPGRKLKIKLILSNFKGDTIGVKDALTNEKIVLDPASDWDGIGRITAISMEQGFKGSTYIFRGDLEQKTSSLIRKAENRSDCHAEILYNFYCTYAILDFKNGFFKDTYEISFKEAYDFILEKIADFEKYLLSEDTTVTKTLPAIYKKGFMYFQKSVFDEDFTVGWVQVPDNYRPGKSMALMINANFGAGGCRYPYITTYSEIGLFKDAVILNICGRGGVNRDFINEQEIIRIINRTLDDFTIDRDRIVLMGNCTGGLKIFSMAFHYPSVFSALVSIGSTVRLELLQPDYTYCKNAGNIMVYSFINIEDYALNAARIIDTALNFKYLKQLCYSPFIHMEFGELFHSRKLLQSAIKEKRNLYARNIEFTTNEPHFNKAYWLKIVRIRNLNDKARIHAKIMNNAQINLELDNIEVLDLLIDRRKLKLQKQISITANDITKQAMLPDHCTIRLTYDGKELTLSITTLTSLESSESLNKLQMDCSAMGIKEVYTGKCLIIKPDYYDDAAGEDFTEKMFHMLQSPLSEKIRNYNFPLKSESSLSGKIPADSHFVYCFDACKEQSAFLKDYDFEFTPEVLKINDKNFYDASFFFYKVRRPINPDKSGLLIAYNSDEVKNEILKFMDSFDTNPLFYHDLVVYNKGSYHGFRIIR